MALEKEKKAANLIPKLDIKKLEPSVLGKNLRSCGQVNKSFTDKLQMHESIDLKSKKDRPVSRLKNCYSPRPKSSLYVPVLSTKKRGKLLTAGMTSRT